LRVRSTTPRRDTRGRRERVQSTFCSCRQQLWLGLCFLLLVLIFIQFTSSCDYLSGTLIRFRLDGHFTTVSSTLSLLFNKMILVRIALRRGAPCLTAASRTAFHRGWLLRNKCFASLQKASFSSSANDIMGGISTMHTNHRAASCLPEPALALAYDYVDTDDEPSDAFTAKIGERPSSTSTPYPPPPLPPTAIPTTRKSSSGGGGGAGGGGRHRCPKVRSHLLCVI
jgi:hypothetical protein